MEIKVHYFNNKKTEPKEVNKVKVLTKKMIKGDKI